MLLIEVLLVFQILGNLDAASINNITKDFYSKRNVSISRAFTLEISQSNLTQLTRLEIYFSNKASKILLHRNISQKSVTSGELSCGKLRVGMLKIEYNYGNVYFYEKDLMRYEYKSGASKESTSDSRILRFHHGKKTSRFLLFYYHSSLCVTNQSSIASFTGLLIYDLLPNASCANSQIKVMRNYSQFCIDKYSNETLLHLKELFDLSIITIRIKDSGLSGGLIALIIIAVIFLCLPIGVLCFLKFKKIINFSKKCPFVTCQKGEENSDVRIPLLSSNVKKLSLEELERNTNMPYTELRSKFQRQINASPTCPFYERINKAITIRKENVVELRKFAECCLNNETDIKNDIHVRKCFEIMQKFAESPIVIVLTGGDRLTGADRLFLIRKLFNFHIMLIPQDKIVRISYSEEPVYKIIKAAERNEFYWKICDEKEVLKEGNLEDYDDSNFILERESSLKIVEIGLPSDLLKSGVAVINLPNVIDNTDLTKIYMQVLQQMNPTIICYTYNNKRRFNLKDGVVLDTIHKGLTAYQQHFIQYILAPYVFSDEENEFDTNLEEERQPFDKNDFSFSVKTKCQFTSCRLSEKPPTGEIIWYGFDKDRLLPGFYLPIKTSIREMEPEFLIQLEELRNQIASKISACHCLLSYVAHLIGKVSTTANDNHITNLWYKLKSLSVEDEFVNLLRDKCIQWHLLIDFTKGYKVYAIENEIQVTTVTKNDQIDFNQEKIRIFTENNIRYVKESSYQFYNADEGVIYLIEKEMPHKRFIDHIGDVSCDDFMRKFTFKDEIWYNMKLRGHNFRPDNLYIGSEGMFCINQNIPNDPILPFLVNNEQHCSAFHLHSELKGRYPYLDSTNRQNEIKVEFLYSFGWCLYILTRGIDVLQRPIPTEGELQNLISEFEDNSQYPKRLVDMMKFCLAVNLINADHTVLYLENN